MERDEIRKVLYKEKPMAKRVQEFDLVKIYEAETSVGTLVFEVPYQDMGNNVFPDVEEGKLLWRWFTNVKK